MIEAGLAWTVEDVAAGAGRLDQIDDRLLALVACLPLAPLAALTPFLWCSPGTAHRRLTRLCDEGVLWSLTTPLRAQGRPARLLLPTDLGLVILARRVPLEWPTLSDCLGPPRPAPARPLIDLPCRLAVYDLLALLAASRPGPARLDAWEQPWRRALRPSARAVGGLPRAVRLPAGATLSWDGPDGATTRRYLLVPDTGGLALPAMRGTLGRLAEHQAAGAASAMLVIATTTPRRAAAWADLLDRVCQARHLPPLEARVATWSGLRQDGRAADRQSAGQEPVITMERAMVNVAAARVATTRPAVPSRTRLHTQGRCEAGRTAPTAPPGAILAPLDRAVLDLVGRHPFLPTATLADVLGRDVRWARSRRVRLAARGLLRLVSAEEVTPPELARLGLLELTRDGLRCLAAHLGLPLGGAVRHHGLAGGGLGSPVGPRAALLAHLPHTLGADAVFAGLAKAARRHPGGGALVEWRGPAACAHGRLRPDGYGLVRLGQQQHGFFLEFDRGSMRPARLRAKFLAYHRYRASAHAARAYNGFPVVLVVTTGPGPEQRVTQALRAADVGQGMALPVLVTTVGLLDAVASGPLGPVWRTATDPARRRAWSPNGTPSLS